MESICGEVIDIMYDKKVKKLNLQLAKNETGAPVIILQDWTKKDESKDLVVLHLKEAIRLKAVIDNLVIDFITDFPKEDF